MKECNRCRIVQSDDSYYSSGGRKRAICKTCTQKQKQEVYRTEIGLAKKIYQHQVSSSKKRGMDNPHYDSKYLVKMLCSDKLYLRLFKEWKESGYDKRLTPSVDRIHNDKTYMKDNIRVMTWNENKMLFEADRRAGYTTSQSKSVEMYSAEKELLAIFPSVGFASRETDICATNISSCCRGTALTAGGYVWRYSDVV